MHSSQKKMDIGKGSKLAHRRPWRRRTKHRVSRLSGRGATSSSSCWKGTDHFARTGGAFKPRWLVWQWLVTPRDVPEIPLPTTGIPGRGRRSPRGVGRSRPAARTAAPTRAPPRRPTPRKARAAWTRARRLSFSGAGAGRPARGGARRLRLVPGSGPVLFGSVRFRA